MLFINLPWVIIATGIIPSVLSAVVPSAIPLDLCHAPTVISEAFIGENNDVKTQVIQCANSITAHDAAQLSKRQASSNVCGATCNTNCFIPSGGGPDPNDCHVIADALRYDSQNIGNTFTMAPANNTTLVTMQYLSCLSFIVDQANTPLTYCRADWASVIDWVAPNCQSTQNAHGGNCVAADGRWFIQVQHT